MPSLVGAAASLMDLILPLICTNDQSPTETNKQTNTSNTQAKYTAHKRRRRREDDDDDDGEEEDS
jgi:hypothetical protein